MEEWYAEQAAFLAKIGQETKSTKPVTKKEEE